MLLVVGVGSGVGVGVAGLPLEMIYPVAIETIRAGTRRSSHFPFAIFASTWVVKRVNCTTV